MNSESEETYEVESIVKHRIRNGSTEFLIRWVGYQSDDDSWVAESDLNCPEILQRYKEKCEEERKQTKAKKGSWKEIIINNPPIKIVKKMEFAGEKYLRVRLANQTYATFHRSFLKKNCKNLFK